MRSPIRCSRTAQGPFVTAPFIMKPRPAAGGLRQFFHDARQRRRLGSGCRASECVFLPHGESRQKGRGHALSNDGPGVRRGGGFDAAREDKLGPQRPVNGRRFASSFSALGRPRCEVLFSRPWTLGSVSPLQMIRGMLDMSLRGWHGSPLLGTARALLLAAVIWGGVTLTREPGRGTVIAGIGLLGFYALRRQ